MHAEFSCRRGTGEATSTFMTDQEDPPLILPDQYQKMLLDLEGYLGGIAMDSQLTKAEIRLLKHWLIVHNRLLAKPPFDQLWTLVETAVQDGVIEEEAWKDMLWLIESLTKNQGKGSQKIVWDMRRLQGMLRGILADGVITEEELAELQDWLQTHEHMEGYWPYDEIFRIVREVLKDGRIDARERDLLQAYFNDFALITPEMELKGSTSKVPSMTSGIVSHEPRIEFKGYHFSFTGVSGHGSRDRLVTAVQVRGGIYQKQINEDLNYLVVGQGIGDELAFSCFGRKVDEAVRLRQGGVPLQIVSEADFWKATGETRNGGRGSAG
jgi:hypothetical protein